MSANFIALGRADFTEYLDVLSGMDFDFTSGVSTSSNGKSISCGRASSAMQFTETGAIEFVPANAVRYSRHPLTGQCYGLLAEPAATNTLAHNMDLTHASWPKHACSVTPSDVLGLDGQAMFKIAEDTTSTYHGLPTALYNLSVDGFASASVYVKKAERDHVYVEIGMPGNGAFNAVVNLNDGSAVQGGELTGWLTVTACKSDIYLIKMTAKRKTTAVTQARFSILTHNGESQIYAGTAGSGLLVQYPQYEASPRSTSTIKTNESAATRPPENLYIDAVALSGQFNPADFTLYAKAMSTLVPVAAYAPGEVTPGVICAISTALTGAAAVRTLIARNSTSLLPVVFARGTGGSITLSGPSTWREGEMALAFSSKGVFSCNGQVIKSDGFIPTDSNRIQLGSSRPDAEYFEGVISAARIYRTALPENDLKALTLS